MYRRYIIYTLSGVCGLHRRGIHRDLRKGLYECGEGFHDDGLADQVQVQDTAHRWSWDRRSSTRPVRGGQVRRMLLNPCILLLQLYVCMYVVP